MRARTTKCCNEMCGWVRELANASITHTERTRRARYMRVSVSHRRVLCVAAHTEHVVAQISWAAKSTRLDLQMNSVIEELDESKFTDINATMVRRWLSSMRLGAAPAVASPQRLNACVLG